MKSNSDIAKDVRDYYIKIHQFIIEYKNTINDAIDNKLNKILKGYVYILLVNKKRNIHKIGIIKENGEQVVKNRLRNYMTGRDRHPEIEFIIKIEDVTKITSCINKMLKDDKLHGKNKQEIFKISFEDARDVVLKCGCINGTSISKLKNNTNCYIIFTNPNVVLK
jgi:hypothetical protein